MLPERLILAKSANLIVALALAAQPVDSSKSTKRNSFTQTSAQIGPFPSASFRMPTIIAFTSEVLGVPTT